MEKKKLSYLILAAGILLFGLGLFLIKQELPEGWYALPFICVGIGCGLFGHSVGTLISHRIEVRNPADFIKDERNTAIDCRAKAKAYDRMIYVFGALMMVFALMGVDVLPVLLLVAAYLAVVGCFIYYLGKYNKEM